MLTKRRVKSKKTHKGASGNATKAAADSPPTPPATPARHPLLDDFGHGRLQDFRRQHAESINGLDSATISIQVPQNGFENAPQEIHSWTIIGPRGLVEAVVSATDAWVREASAKITPQELPADFFCTRPLVLGIPDVSDLVPKLTDAEHHNREKLARFISTNISPRLSQRKEATIEINIWEDGDSTAVFEESLSLSTEETLALSRELAVIAKKYASLAPKGGVA